MELNRIRKEKRSNRKLLGSPNCSDRIQAILQAHLETKTIA